MLILATMLWRPKFKYIYIYIYCDAPNASEELPTPVASPPRSPTLPAAQVRQYSWHHYAKKEVCLYIHTLKPLKVRQKSERENQQYSVIRDNAERSNSKLNQLVHVPQYANNYTL